MSITTNVFKLSMPLRLSSISLSQRPKIEEHCIKYKFFMIMLHPLMTIAPFRLNALQDEISCKLCYFVGKMRSVFLFPLALACYQCETVESGKK